MNDTIRPVEGGQGRLYKHENKAKDTRITQHTIAHTTSSHTTCRRSRGYFISYTMHCFFSGARYWRNNGKLIPRDWDPTHVSENWGGKRPAQIFELLSSARSI